LGLFPFRQPASSSPTQLPLPTHRGLFLPGTVLKVLEIPRNRILQSEKFLLELGADVNLVNAAGLTPLHGAAASGADSAVQLLVANGAKVDVKDKLGRAPLYFAERVDLSIRAFAQDGTADLLLKLGAVPLSDPAARRSHLAIMNRAR
jgi:ankyrin repeat protein